jgi:hypothetical protein
MDIVSGQGLNKEIGLLLAMLDDSTANWREELGDVSQEAIVWQSVPNGHNIGAILFHNADVEAYWLHEIATGQPRSCHRPIWRHLAHTATPSARLVL